MVYYNDLVGIEAKLAHIMGMKKLIGEFSVDLYYNDLADASHAYVAKVHDPFNRLSYHARAMNFEYALDSVYTYLLDFSEVRKQQEN